MKKTLFVLLIVLSAFLLISNAAAKEIIRESSGESLFLKNCAQCHPEGGNIINKQKTLHRKDLDANNIRTAEDIVKKVRNPGPAPTHPATWSGMKKFDERELSTDDALKIGDYILKTFQ
jgi:cytochrome c6